MHDCTSDPLLLSGSVTRGRTRRRKVRSRGDDASLIRQPPRRRAGQNRACFGWGCGSGAARWAGSDGAWARQWPGRKRDRVTADESINSTERTTTRRCTAQTPVQGRARHFKVLRRRIRQSVRLPSYSRSSTRRSQTAESRAENRHRSPWCPTGDGRRGSAVLANRATLLYGSREGQPPPCAAKRQRLDWTVSGPAAARGRHHRGEQGSSSPPKCVTCAARPASPQPPRTAAIVHPDSIWVLLVVVRVTVSQRAVLSAQTSCCLQLSPRHVVGRVWSLRRAQPTACGHGTIPPLRSGTTASRRLPQHDHLLNQRQVRSRTGSTGRLFLPTAIIIKQHATLQDSAGLQCRQRQQQIWGCFYQDRAQQSSPATWRSRAACERHGCVRVGRLAARCCRCRGQTHNGAGELARAEACWCTRQCIQEQHAAGLEGPYALRWLRLGGSAGAPGPCAVTYGPSASAGDAEG